MTLLEMIEKAKRLAQGKPDEHSAYVQELIKLVDQDIKRLKTEPLTKQHNT